jgi:MFS family permease
MNAQAPIGHTDPGGEGRPGRLPLARDPWLLAMSLARMLMYANFMVYAACLPVLRPAWDMSATQAGSVSGAFMLGYAFSLVAFSWLAQHYGARRLFLISAALSALSALLFGLFARSYPSALALYALAAITQGGTYGPAIMLFADRYAPQARGRAVGVLIASTSLGYAGSLLLSGWLLAHGGYELAFITTGSLVAVGVVMAYATLRHTPNVVHSHTLGTSRLKGVFGQANARRLIIGYTGHSWELLGMWSWFPAFIAASLALSTTSAVQAAAGGAYLAAGLHLCGALAASWMGSLSDRFGRRLLLVVLATSSALLSLSIGWLIGWPFAMLLGLTFVYGFTALGDSPVLSTALTEAVAPYALGAALAVRSLLGFSAGALAPLVFGAVLDATNPPGVTPTTWGWAFVTLGLGGLVAAWYAYQLEESAPLKP